ncbi:hypothetical protein RvY_07355 [Ramazzottius varieornatus]|uniref:HTH CENPB-type domain-containing protein n=1 Tax=Ramazzottius varieornatus TaxID=947166 RepID=A0A1D1V4F7_RAMVA|nr:hypothetical protein RvY_07355 [Ramazzottius varieornatus]
MGRPHAMYRVSEALRNVRGQEQSGKSVNAHAKLVTIPESTIRGWRKKLPKGTYKSRRKPVYEDVERRVYPEFVRTRNVGLPVRDTDIRIWAVQSAKSLNLNDCKASNGWLYPIKKKYRLTYRATTKVGRKTKPSAEDEAPGEKERFTVGLAVTGDGRKFPAAILFKGEAKTGKLSGRIVNKLVTPDNVIVYSTRTAWWNSRLDLEWIDDFFYGKDLEFLFLLRDHFPGHLKFESAELLEEMKVHQVFIPKGLTGKYQPRDVGVNAPLKSLMKKAYHEWRKVRTDVTSKGYLKKLSRQDFINFVSEAWSQTTPETIENAFVGAQILPEPTFAKIPANTVIKELAVFRQVQRTGRTHDPEDPGVDEFFLPPAITTEA